MSDKIGEKFGAERLQVWLRGHPPEGDRKGEGVLPPTPRFPSAENPESIRKLSTGTFRVMVAGCAVGITIIVTLSFVPTDWIPVTREGGLRAVQAAAPIRPEDTVEPARQPSSAAQETHGQAQLPLSPTNTQSSDTGPAPSKRVAQVTALPKTLTTRGGTAYEHVSVSRVEPDGLTIEYTPRGGGIGLAKLRFRELPEIWQQHYSFDPGAASVYEREQARARARSYTQPIAARPAEFSSSERASKTALLRNLASDYRRTHTYSLEDSYVCVDMACDVWNMVKTKGLEARIMVGNVQRDMWSLEDANHAWVLAEVSPGEWLAIEATGGFVIFQNENSRYYRGRMFSSPREFKAFYYGRGSGARSPSENSQTAR
jgi:hypothetical protein